MQSGAMIKNLLVEDNDLLVVEVEVKGRLFQKKLVLRRVYHRRS